MSVSQATRKTARKLLERSHEKGAVKPALAKIDGPFLFKGNTRPGVLTACDIFAGIAEERVVTKCFFLRGKQRGSNDENKDDRINSGFGIGQCDGVRPVRQQHRRRKLSGRRTCG